MDPNLLSTISNLPEPVPVCGYQIMPFTPGQLVQHVLGMIRSRKGGWVLALNLDLVARGVRQPEYKALICKADITVADGHPLVWGMKKNGMQKTLFQRCTGSDLTQKLLHLVSPLDCAIIGGKDPRSALINEGLDPAAGWSIFDGMVKIEPGIADTLKPYIEDRHLVFVALGVPKQEQLIEILRPLYPETTFIGVGGSFEFLAGITNRAPVWMQDRGLEWLYRLASEPKRLWRRYLIEYVPGGIALLKDVRHYKKLNRNKMNGMKADSSD